MKKVLLFDVHYFSFLNMYKEKKYLTTFNDTNILDFSYKTTCRIVSYYQL